MCYFSRAYIMSFVNEDTSLREFTERVVQSLSLQVDSQRVVWHHNNLLNWMASKEREISSAKSLKESEGFLESLWSKSKNSKNSKASSSEIGYYTVKEYLKDRKIDAEFTPKKEDFPEYIIQGLQLLQKHGFPTYYAVVKGPLLPLMYLNSREDFNSCIEAGVRNNLRFSMIDAECAQKYQRNLIQEMLGRVFRQGSSLTLVIKVQITRQPGQPPIELFCYVEDLSDEDKYKAVTLDHISIKEDSHNQLSVMYEDKTIGIDDCQLIDIILGEILVTPFQTLVPSYLVRMEEQGHQLTGRLVKSNQRRTQGSSLKDHASLRNPLLYFQGYIKNREIRRENCKLRHGNLLAKFYDTLDVLVELVLHDYTFTEGDLTKSSLRFSFKTFETLWNLFHELYLVQNWIDEIVLPIKNSLRISELFERFCPIMNQVTRLEFSNLKQYQEYMMNVKIENYISQIPKYILLDYKERFLADDYQQEECVSYKSREEVYNNIIMPVMDQQAFEHMDLNEAVYFLQFIAKNKRINEKNQHMYFQPKLWKRVYDLIDSDHIKIDLHLDYLGFQVGIDTVELSRCPFRGVRHQVEDDLHFQKLDAFITVLEKKYEKKYCAYMSLFLEKAFKESKFETCRVLVLKGAMLRNFENIFTDQELLKENQQKAKKRVMDTLQNKFPQSYRRYRWEELICLKLPVQHSEKQVNFVHSIKYGKIAVNSCLFKEYLSQTSILNNLSRKDYLFDSDKEIARISINNYDMYIENTQYPLVREFYRIFFEELDSSDLLLNSINLCNPQGHFFNIIECIPNSTTFQKLNSQFSERQIKNGITGNSFSAAILITMLIMPAKISSKNLILSDTENGKRIFMINLKDFYQTQPILKQNGNYVLHCSNVLFLFDEMKNNIHQNLMELFSQLDIPKILHQTLQQCSEMVAAINTMKQRELEEVSTDLSHQQLLGMIFEEKWVINLAERMFKVQRCFREHLKRKETVSHMEVLSLISPELANYYTEVLQSSPSLQKREELLNDQLWTKPFVNNHSMLGFFSESLQLEETRYQFPQHYYKYSFQGPYECLKELHSCWNYFKAFQQEPLNLEVDLHDFKVLEYWIRNASYQDYTKPELDRVITKWQELSQEYLKQVKNRFPFSIMRLDSINLNSRKFQFSSERLKEFVLDNCQIADSELSVLLRKLNYVSVIKLNKIKGLKTIGESSILSENISMKNLNTLTILNCAQLISIDMKSVVLENLVLRNNEQLETIFINSKQLRNMDCSFSNRLKMENIGVYVVKGINVLLNQWSCEGHLVNLEHGNYSRYIFRFLKQIFSNFKDQEVKNTLAITLVKLGEISELDEAVTNMSGISMLGAAVSNLIFKVNPLLENKFLVKLFEIFYRNKSSTQFRLDDLEGMKVENLKLISDFFKGKQGFKREFKELHIGKMEPETISQLMVICNEVPLDKVLLLSIKHLEKTVEDSQELKIIDSVINQRKGIDKINLRFADCYISTHIMQLLLPDSQSIRLNSMEFYNSIVNNIFVPKHPISAVKKVSIGSCELNSLEILTRMDHLNELIVKDSTFTVEADKIFAILGQLTTLKTLRYISQKAKQPKFSYRTLFKELRHLKQLDLLDLSQNQMIAQELEELNKFCSESQVHELILLDCLPSHQDDYNFDHFLCESKIRSLSIQFYSKHEQSLNSFFHLISQNETISNLYIQTENEIPSKDLKMVNMNKKLESVRSNQLIPVWLQNLAKQNIKNRSNVFNVYDLEASSSKNNDYYKLGLSMDGGGMRGLLLATELQYLANEVGYPLHKIFDCMGGTSIGGILSLAVSGTNDNRNPICTPEDCIDLFVKNGKEIFKKSQMMQFSSLYDTKYPASSFEALLNSYFKNSKLSDVLQDTKVVVTAVSRLDNKDLIFKSTDAILNQQKDFYMRDVARATSAAPTYFSSAQIKNITATQKYSLLDGGVGLNNPSKLVIDEIKKMAFNSNKVGNYFLVSLGTGRLPSEVIPENAGMKDLAPIIDSFTESANFFAERDLTENYKGHFIRVSPLLKLNKKDAELDRTDEQTLNIYRQTGIEAARKYFSDTIVFGKYRNLSLVEWLRENTARKYDL